MVVLSKTVCDEIFDIFAKHHVDARKRRRDNKYAIRKRVDALTDNRVAKKNTTTGEERLALLDYILEHGFEWKRHLFDRKIQEALVRAFAPTLFGEEWGTVGQTICNRRGWRFMSKLVCGKAPRRFGKSVAISKFIVAVTEVVLTCLGFLSPGQNFTISIFSTSQRASSGIKEYTRRFLAERRLDGAIIRNQQELTKLCQDKNNPSSPTVSINFLPSRAQR